MPPVTLLAAVPSDGVVATAIATDRRGVLFLNVDTAADVGVRVHLLVEGEWYPHWTGNLNDANGQPYYDCKAAVGRSSFRLVVPKEATHACAVKVSGGAPDDVRLMPSEMTDEVVK